MGLINDAPPNLSLIRKFNWKVSILPKNELLAVYLALHIRKRNMILMDKNDTFNQNNLVWPVQLTNRGKRSNLLNTYIPNFKVYLNYNIWIFKV